MDTYFINGLSLAFKGNLYLYPIAVLVDLILSFCITGLFKTNKYTAKYLLGE